MSDDSATIGVRVPLDSDGFLRRECPTCEREFKWLHTPQDGAVGAAISEGGYYCPYCGVQAASWFTKAQALLARNVVATDVVGPMIAKLSKDISRNSRGAIGMSMNYTPPDKMDPLTEVDDMRRVNFACHEAEPVKVLDEWSKDVYCLICGVIAS